MMNSYEKRILKKWFLFLVLFLIFKYPLSKLLGKNDIYYITVFVVFTIISIIQILKFRREVKLKKDNKNI